MKLRFFHPAKIILATCIAGLFSSATAQAWWNGDWTIRKKITIDTSPGVAAINEPIGTAVVLVRLHDGDFQFSSARDDGSDLRFIAADDKTPLPFDVEKYDSLLGEAFVWVKVSDLKPGAVTHFWLYYGNTGNKTMPGGADARTTHDSDTELDYHFADGVGQPPHDSSAAGNSAGNAGLSIDGSFIGPGLKLDGKQTVTIPASPSLAWDKGASFTWSAWIKAAALQPNAILFSRRDGANDFLIGADNGALFIEVNESRSTGGAPIAVNAWHQLTVVADTGKITLYLDGAPYGSLAAPLAAMNSPEILGADPGATTPGSNGFLGEMDELQISRVARATGLIKFTALEESGDMGAKILVTAPDEGAPAGWLSGAFGLFGVILKSVTIDGWVVISVLGIMALVSWYVMITKFFYLQGVHQGNASFLKEWQHVATDLTVLEHGDAEKVKTLGGRVNGPKQRGLRHASLYRIYHIGAQEISHRMSDPTRMSRVLSAQSIQAIRASLDGGFVRESQALNASLVFLTISIAGGPFLGLLGTVIGVMITFAAIAASGEVNINAIAPGIAAALVATVAGLLVAIPALLGYNYLVAQIKNVTSDMQIFVDEFVTKMAEFYRPSTDS